MHNGGIAQDQVTVYSLGIMVLTTDRLRLVPATADLVRLELEDRNALFRKLGVCDAPDWPSEALAHVLPSFLEDLQSDPSLVGWLNWYWILLDPGQAELVGGGGFKGHPQDGDVEIGYETRCKHRRRGFAAEAVSAQVQWALEQEGVRRVAAEANKSNAASISVLRAAGFECVGPGSRIGLLRFLRQEGS
jgi:[ribosomal protein S5]-alanine N-acetyltransferase